MTQLYASESDSDPEEAEDKNWLDVLPSHPIFALPYDTLADGNVPLPASPGLSAIGDRDRDDASDVSQVLAGLDRMRLMKNSSSAQPVRQCNMAVVRDTELIVAVGKELRIASLADVKSRVAQESIAGPSSAIGSYKVLNTPSITFDVLSLIASPTNPKLLAVVGRSEVVVLVLPRKEWSALVSGRIDCRTASIGQYHHGPRSSNVASVKWHPLGFRGATLCILTEDGVLREYDVNGDVSEPTSVLDFAQSNLSKPTYARPTRHSFASPSHNASMHSFTEDEDDMEAVSLCFGAGSGDWGPLTAYCLMRDGTIFAVCPYLPQTASVNATYLDSLRRFVTFKSENFPTADQAMEDASRISFDAPHTPDPAYTDLRSRSRLATQLKYVAALSKHTQAATASTSFLDDNANGDLPPGHVKITIDSELARWSKPRRQGPFLLQPAPLELEGEVESNACDLAYTTAQAHSEEDEVSAGLLIITYSDGKVDVCLEVEKLEGRWDTQNEEDLPSLLVYETIDLGIASAMSAQQPGIDLFSELSNNYSALVADPIYSNSFYVYHNFGVHSLSVGRWLQRLLSLLLEGDSDNLQAFLAEDQKTETSWVCKTLSLSPGTQSTPIGGLSLLKDVYLGYSLLMLTTSLQLVALELALIPYASNQAAKTQSVESKTSNLQATDQLPSYIPIISRPIFEPAARLDIASRKTGAPRFVMPTSSQGKPLEITPETLRFLGQTVASLRTSIRDLVSSGNAVQNRFELQCKELAKQLEKIAELRNRTQAIAKGGSGDLKKRLDGIESNQKALLHRADRVLQRLMDGHEPELSTYEAKWFEELNRMQMEVGAQGSGKGLQDRVARVMDQLALLRRQAHELERSKLDEGAPKMGRSQVARLEAMLSDESKVLATTKNKIASLNQKLATHLL